MTIKSILTSSILLAVISFSLAVDTPTPKPSSTTKEDILNSNSEEKVTTLHQLTNKDSLKLIQQIADEIKLELFNDYDSNDTRSFGLQGKL